MIAYLKGMKVFLRSLGAACWCTCTPACLPSSSGCGKARTSALSSWESLQTHTQVGKCVSSCSTDVHSCRSPDSLREQRECGAGVPGADRTAPAAGSRPQTRPSGQRPQVHGHLPETANLLLTLQRLHLVHTHTHTPLKHGKPSTSCPVSTRISFNFL